MEAKKKEISNKLLEEKMKNEKIDISPAFSFNFPKGHYHIISKAIEEMSDIFVSLGFNVLLKNSVFFHNLLLSRYLISLLVV